MRCFDNNSERIGIYAGFLYEPIFLVILLISLFLNPWFNFRNNALSDLGALGVPYAWVFNTGLIATGVLGSLFSWEFLRHMHEPLNIYGYGLLISSVLFILVGIFPENADYTVYGSISFHHFFAYSGFFVASVTILLFGFYWLTQKGWRVIAVFLLTVSLVCPSIAYIDGGPGIAIFETTFSFLTLLWTYLTIYYQCVAGDKNRASVNKL